MMTHWYPATFYLLLPLIGNELGLSFGQIGSILTCQFAAGALSNLPGGMVVDAIGRKGLLMAVALSWVGLPYLVMGLSYSYWMLLVCAALVGVGNNLWHPTAIPLLAQNHPERRGLVVSIHSMGGNLGDAVAPLAVGGMLTIFSWRDVVVINVVPGMAASVLLLLLLGRDGGALGRHILKTNSGIWHRDGGGHGLPRSRDQRRTRLCACSDLRRGNTARIQRNRPGAEQPGQHRRERRGIQ